MNILFDHQIFCIQKYGGISRYFYELANNLRKLDQTSVEIFCPLHTNEYFYENNQIRPRGMRLPRAMPQMLSRRISSLTNVISFSLLKDKLHPDIFHETYYSLFDCCPPGAKRIITVCDMIHEKFPENFSILDKTREIKARSLHRADHIICISENTKRDLLELTDIPNEKISVIYLGHSFSTYAPSLKRNRQNKPHLLYVGKRNGYKNFANLLKAYSESKLLKNEFSIACFGGGSFTSAELKLFKALTINPDNVIYASGDDNELAAWYRSAAVFIYPSLYEGFGIPPLEAMSCDCPVVCSNNSSLPEVVGSAAELFNPEDTTEMRLAIERVVSSPDYSAQLIAKGKQRVKLFSWDKCAKDTLNTYHQLLNN
ncbi:Mannosyltransferase [Methylomonas albis]|uniref:Glycosyltransferase family 4 protein n=1 Tax=Methylomonas albis TaxID=1854563 RepID=A0ABR9D1G0_9GAMM|nr:glycosyltransferase family 1 protein [Methylomonas albis]MBD9356064.1 glycosyltransferase family 4 protein [Methylomonas albis]CAD6879114.1 Mannosyltransferase [Methylomonas albis]